MKVKLNWDGLGIATSVVCAIHCALLPVLVSSLPIFGINIVHNSFFEWGMIALAFAVGMYSLRHGYIVHHHSIFPISIFLVGFVFLVLKQFFTQLEFWFLFIAVGFIIVAHYFNYKLCQKSKCASAHHQH